MRKTVYDCTTKETLVVDMSPDEEARMLAHHAEMESQPRIQTLEERIAILEQKEAQRART